MGDDGNSKGFFFYLFVFILCEIGVIFVLVPPEVVANVVAKERTVYASHLGAEAESDIRRHADRIFTSWFLDTGFRDSSYHLLIGAWQGDLNDPARLDDRGIEQWTLRRLQSTWGALYQTIYRGVAMAAWLPFLLPIMAAIIFDGVNQWRVRQWQFTYSSQTIHSIGLGSILYGLAFLVIVIVAPITISPWFAPVILIGSSMLAWMVVVNMSKRF